VTVRIYPVLTAANWRDYKAYGLSPGSGDDLIALFIYQYRIPKASAAAMKSWPDFQLRDAQKGRRRIVSSSIQHD